MEGGDKIGGVRFKKRVSFGDKTWKPGDIAVLDDEIEQRILDQDAEAIERIEQLDEEPELKISEEPSSERKPEGESKKGVDVDEFAKTESQFLTADMVSEGDLIEILGSGEVDDETWDTERLLLPAEHESGVEGLLSIGKRNARRIGEGYGSNTSNWIGKEVRVVSIEEYPQLGTKGMILKPAEYVDEE